MSPVTNAGEPFGVAILSDCKYGWDKPDGKTLRLTLLHTPKSERGFTYQNFQDIGRHKMLYALCGHAGDWRKGGVVGVAARLNQPLVAYQVDSHKAKLGPSFSLIQLSDPGVVVRALKKAEDSDEIVVRLQETGGMAVKGAQVSLATGISAARELNGAEKEIGRARVVDKQLQGDHH